MKPTKLILLLQIQVKTYLGLYFKQIMKPTTTTTKIENLTLIKANKEKRLYF